MVLELGQLVATRGVADKMAEDAVFASFARGSLAKHTSGNWGDLCPEDKEANEVAVRNGDIRVFSAYTQDGLPKIWIITEADRSVTTILFPDEY